MRETLEIASTLIVPLGTQVVLRAEIADPSQPIPKGTVAEIVRTPADGSHSYGLRSADGAEIQAFRQDFSILKHVKMGPMNDTSRQPLDHELSQSIIYRCVVGSQAYGLNREGSDVDRRGIYLPPADLEWSLYGVPEQLENRATEECYWEFKKFLILALKANPTILECLWSPIIEQTSQIAEALLATAFGLGAAIPAVIFYNIFQSRISAFGTRAEGFVAELMNALSRQLDKGA